MPVRHPNGITCRCRKEQPRLIASDEASSTPDWLFWRPAARPPMIMSTTTRVRRMRLPAAVLIAVMTPLTAWAATPAVFNAAAPTIAGHRATYALGLKSSTDQGVLAADGSMTYDVTDACTGWTTSQHLIINLTDRDGREVRMVSDYATFETKDGSKLTFHTKQMTDQTVTEQLDGVAVLDRSGGHGHADFSAPEHKRVLLPAGTMLPNAHTLAVLQAAMTGKRFLAVPLFDGTGSDGAQDSFVTIENWHGPRTEKWSSLSGLPSGRVHVAFFDRDQTTEMPDYEIGMRYFNNGVADDLAMNFGDFVMAGKLDQFELKNGPRC